MNVLLKQVYIYNDQRILIVHSSMFGFHSSFFSFLRKPKYYPTFRLINFCMTLLPIFRILSVSPLNFPIPKGYCFNLWYLTTGLRTSSARKPLFTVTWLTRYTIMLILDSTGEIVIFDAKHPGRDFKKQEEISVSLLFKICFYFWIIIATVFFLFFYCIKAFL